MKKMGILLLLLLQTVFLWAQSVSLNEFLAINDSYGTDDTGARPDWIELFNGSDGSVSLFGYSLTDKPDTDAVKWIFPDITLQRGDFLIVWASGRDISHADSALHTHFKLDGDGEMIILRNAEGECIDSVSFDEQEPDVSLGRIPDGTGNFVSCFPPTPGSPNSYHVELFMTPPEGVYRGPQSLQFVANVPDADIRYTLDGSLPGRRSPRYTDPIVLSQTAVVRAAILAHDTLYTPVISHSYIINDIPRLPILSLITAPENLWDQYTGICVNFDERGDAWERPGHIAYFKDEALQFSEDIGVRLHGGNSRRHPKKNFKIYFRNEYGKSWLEYPLFPQKELDRFKRLVIYAPSSDQVTGRTIYTYLCDALTHDLWDQIDGHISGFTPVSLYLNGAYWGLYWIRERIDRYYVETNLGIEDMDLQRANWSDYYLEEREGDREYWDETYSYFSVENFSREDVLQTALDKYIVEDNFIDNTIVNIFTANRTWPQYNVDRVRDRSGDPRWIYLMWDVSSTWVILDENDRTLEWASRDKLRDDIREAGYDKDQFLYSTLLFRRLLENDAFRYRFINRYSDLLNTNFKPGEVYKRIEELKTWIEPDMERELLRWGGEMWRWEANVHKINQFASRRPAIQHQHITEKFGLYGTYTMRILPPVGEGRVQVNTIVPEDLPWEGTYHRGIPIPLKALPAKGYRFKAWQSPSLPDTGAVILIPSQPVEVQAVFEPHIKPELVIQDVRIDSVHKRSAQVQWTTDRETRGSIAYGYSTLLGYSTGWETGYRNTHPFILTDLDPGSQVTFRILNVDMDGDSTFGPDSTFLTQAALQISDVQASQVSDSSAVIGWKSSRPSKGSVEFGPNLQYGQFAFEIQEWDTVHSAYLTGLAWGTRYHYRIQGWEADNDSVITPDFSFLTQTEHTPPVIQNVRVDSIGIHVATILWETDEPSSGRVLWGPDTEVSLEIPSPDSASIQHHIKLDGLDPETRYYYQIESRDLKNNRALSAIDSFYTQNDTTTSGSDWSENFIPDVFHVSENYPNPFNPETAFVVSVPKPGKLTVQIFNLYGRLVRTLSEGRISPGIHRHVWTGLGQSGKPVSSGIYLLTVFYRPHQGGQELHTQRLMLLK